MILVDLTNNYCGKVPSKAFFADCFAAMAKAIVRAPDGGRMMRFICTRDERTALDLQAIRDVNVLVRRRKNAKPPKHPTTFRAIPIIVVE